MTPMSPEKLSAFRKSQTRENLMRAFAGECQARTRYAMAAKQAKSGQLQSIARIFDFTSQQEYAHAMLFMNALADCKGDNISVDGNYPVDAYPNVLDQLKAAHHNELQEWEHDYKTFSHIAEREEFPLVAKLFDTVAEVEHVHANRFERYAKRMEQGTLYANPEPVEWMCLHCGMVVHSTLAPAHCPLCSHDQGYFIRRDENPFY